MPSQATVLYDEPMGLFLDDMKVTVQSESLMAVIAGGANKLSEIPFGESPNKSERGIYRNNDPMMDFYHSFIMPNMSSLGRGRKNLDEVLLNDLNTSE